MHLKTRRVQAIKLSIFTLANASAILSQYLKRKPRRVLHIFVILSKHHHQSISNILYGPSNTFCWVRGSTHISQNAMLNKMVKDQASVNQRKWWLAIINKIFSQAMQKA